MLKLKLFSTLAAYLQASGETLNASLYWDYNSDAGTVEFLNQSK